MAKPINEEGIKCPFYRSMDVRALTCEGITDDCVCVIRFDSHEKKEQHRRVFCSRKYENCELYQMLEKKYEE